MAEIKNLKKAAERILQAIKKKEKIILYGDADLDGVSSVIILEETIKNLGGKVSALYFPDREIEGYGISKTGLDFFKKEAPALLIAVDCGIGNFREVKLAKKLGFEVIIIDHHEVLDVLPEADIIVDPKQKGDKYPFKNLASAGIIFKLSETLLKKRMTSNLRRTFLELVALGTIADMMPRQSENKIFIEEGLHSLENSWRPGIKVFLETDPFKSYQNLNQKVSKIISILNIRDVKMRLPASFRLLTTSSFEEAKKIIGELLEKSKIRKEIIEKMTEEIEKRITKKTEPIIFEGDSTFELTLISSVASIICQKYQKPTFLYKKMVDESQGTVRVPTGINSVALMKKCSKYPLTFGGHPQASGFRIKNEDLEKFKKCLIKNL
jgi:single-stranded-DNA-specific exonuclease